MWEYGLNMIDLVLTHLGHHWGPPRWFDALKSVPVLDFGHIRNAPKLPISPKMTAMSSREVSETMAEWKSKSITLNLLTDGQPDQGKC